jgi:hypothetical protein
MAKETRGLTTKEKREGGRKRSEESIILIEGQDDQRSFKLSSCGAKILTGDNRFQNGPFTGVASSTACVPFFPFLPYPPHLPPSPRFRSPSPPLFVISILSLLPTVRFSPPLFSLFFYTSTRPQQLVRAGSRDLSNLPSHGFFTPARSGASELT